MRGGIRGKEEGGPRENGLEREPNPVEETAPPAAMLLLLLLFMLELKSSSFAICILFLTYIFSSIFLYFYFSLFLFYTILLNSQGVKIKRGYDLVGELI